MIAKSKSINIRALVLTLSGCYRKVVELPPVDLLFVADLRLGYSNVLWSHWLAEVRLLLTKSIWRQKALVITAAVWTKLYLSAG
jgi:hypothetical protein